MYLLLGDPQDLCCLRVRAALEERNYPTCIITNPLAHPSRFIWRLDNEEFYNQLVFDEKSPASEAQINGVLVRSTGWIDPTGWQSDDLAYMQVETQAALLAWLWKLTCPVVNRYPSAIWYNRKVPLLFWHRLLRRCGLPTLETMVTNVNQEARAFGQRLTAEGLTGTVYGPLTSDVRYLVADEKDWRGLTALQGIAPVCLAVPHKTAQMVCVVGDQVVWDGEPSHEFTLLEPALRRFTTMIGLAFVELALAQTSERICVIAVEPYPHFECFSDAAQQQITEEIVNLLTVKLYNSRQSAAQNVHGSLL